MHALIDCDDVVGRLVDDVRNAPLRRMHALRNILTAHTIGTAKAKEQRKAIAEHNTYRSHFENLAAAVLNGLSTIVEGWVGGINLPDLREWVGGL